MTNLLSKKILFDFFWAGSLTFLNIHYFRNSTIYCSTPYSTVLNVKNWFEKNLLNGICDIWGKTLFCWLLLVRKLNFHKNPLNLKFNHVLKYNVPYSTQCEKSIWKFLVCGYIFMVIFNCKWPAPGMTRFLYQ